MRSPWECFLSVVYDVAGMLIKLSFFSEMKLLTNDSCSLSLVAAAEKDKNVSRPNSLYA